ncbi:ATP-binding cassette domain-containing protein [Virgibacillus dakarensis]|uniref:ABC transporter ATP-binding protein YvfR n=1 Tax=Lentibacillus populi TaxID=1827502 RepID=A0A9W5X670_9BACI|nr:ABC transporter ATP-binding protein [Lentibacillus populi]MTW85719.1 ATP-binding cassette domain-containing protein [Virgibacillus dakarensis]GGB46082.1 putative ABC transporter ATP-binding protein YvfR [Lentibacillus populi]
MSNVIILENVSKKFGKVQAVNNVSISIEKGSAVAILGPNGAGKTTTISMMLGLLDPNEGKVELLGKSPKQVAVRNKIGAMLQEVSVMDMLKVHEVLTMFRSYYSSPLSMEELIALTGLEKADLKKKADKLSGGQKRRLGFAIALAGNPDVIFFDEPTVGLDTTARRKFWNKVESLKEKGKTIIFTTHYLEEADDFSERIILFNNGEIIADGEPEDIKRNLTTRSVSFETEDQDAIAKMETVDTVMRCYEKDGVVYVVTEDTDFVLSELFRLNISAKNIRINQGRLDDVFEQLTGDKEEAEAG